MLRNEYQNCLQFNKALAKKTYLRTINQEVLESPNQKFILGSSFMRTENPSEFDC